jgi:hypothetical protein
MNDLPPPGVTRSPFSAAPVKAITRLNESLETPFIKLLGKGVWLAVLGLIALGLYAGKAKLHEEIAANPAVISTNRRLVEVEKEAIESSNARLRLKETDVAVASILDRVVIQQQTMATQLAVVGEQIHQGAISTDKLERTVNRLAERLPPTR